MGERGRRSGSLRRIDELRSRMGGEQRPSRRYADERPGADYRLAGETILGRADWGDRESDYAHGFRAFWPEGPWRIGAPPGRAAYGPPAPPAHEGPGVVRPREPLWHWPEYMGRGPRGYRRPDERILEDVCDRLTVDPRIDATDIDVRVAEGLVTLAGYVRSRDEKWWAEEVAEGVTGVRDLTNEIRVAPEHRRVHT